MFILILKICGAALAIAITAAIVYAIYKLCKELL